MKRAALVIMMGSLLFSAACKKKVPTAGPLPLEAKVEPAKPIDRPVLASTPRIDSFTAEPARVERGQSITLR